MQKTLPFEGIDLAEFRTKSWFCVAPAPHTLEDVLDPRYLWSASHNKGGFQKYEEVTINHEFGNFYVRLLIVAVDGETHSIRCRVLEKHDFTGKSLPVGAMGGATVDWGGPAHKFRVTLGKDVLKHGFSTKEEAEAWLKERSGGEKIAA